MKKILSLLSLTIISISATAQYVEPEKADKIAAQRKATEIVTMPTLKFDSIQAKNMLALGKGKIVGEAFTRQKNGYGMKILDKVKANKIMVTLFPVTPYFEEYYKLWKDKSKNNPKKNKFVYMDRAAMRYRIEAITNSDGEFTFPDMKPGKYYLYGSMDYSLNYNYNKYSGSGYDNYGRIDYYTPSSYTKDFNEFLETFVEVKSDGEIVKVKLK
ncbi:hypothetical protein [Soonwooa sp.]|uniref:hypothetical protein n=1 Tax=Soonwooa sp. TaxID=1938592 RepID=UPI002622CE16|nr:hypothetical protein [Soonwooa sp.]